MKNNLILLLLSVCFSSSILQAQELSQTYLYDEFKDGLVLFKDGRRSSAMLNYNTTVEEMLYKNGEQIWAIANPLEIAAIDIQGDMFVYVNKHIFYQVVKVGVGEVYVEWKTTYFSQGKGAGYGGYSATAAITNYSTFQEGAAVTKLTPNEKFSYKPDNRYWIKNAQGKYVNVTTIKMLQKNFPAKNVKAFCEENNLVHTKHADMLKILEYCFR